MGSGTLLKKAIKKYGRENFKKEIIEECNSIDQLNIREEYWITQLNAIQLGYNIAKGGVGGDTLTNNPNIKKIKNKLSENCLWKSELRDEYIKKYQEIFSGKGNPMFGKHHSDESKKKISNREYARGKDHHAFGKKMSSESKNKLSKSLKGKSGYWKGKNIPNSTRYKMSKKVLQLTLDGTFIKIWDSISDAARYTGASHISSVCKGKRNNSGGYLWKYYIENDNI